MTSYDYVDHTRDVKLLGPFFVVFGHLPSPKSQSSGPKPRAVTMFFDTSGPAQWSKGLKVVRVVIYLYYD